MDLLTLINALTDMHTKHGNVYVELEDGELVHDVDAKDVGGAAKYVVVLS